MVPKFSLVLGGARSGKSAFAEKMALSAGLRPIYLATAQPLDDEMSLRVARHQKTRAGHGWTTKEEPLDLPGALKICTVQDIVLVDCATLWLTNHWMAGSDLSVELKKLGSALSDCAAQVVVVSNELGQGNIAMDKDTRRFNDAHGEMNQHLAAHADLVVAVMAGLPLALKGSLPDV